MRKILLASLCAMALMASEILPESSTQLLLVVADDFNSTTATLQAYTKDSGKWARHHQPIKVNLGRNGLGWGIGLHDFKMGPSDPIKQEGDGKAPAGLFRLPEIFAYDQHLLPFAYVPLNSEDICVDDVTSSAYNQRLRTNAFHDYKSFEQMRRDDNLYKYGIVVAHNPNNLVPRGSCIFIHVQRAEKSPTAGCTSLEEEALVGLLHWLDPRQNPLLLQLPIQAIPDDLATVLNLTAD